jgi:hypothetical protein
MNKNEQKVKISEKKRGMFELTYIKKILGINYIVLGRILITLE